MGSEENDIRGDTIGDTAYSQRYVIEILMKLLKLNKLQDQDLETFIEEDLCTLWDMTVDLDVSLFLLHQNALEIFCDTLNNHENTRLTEVVIGTVANIYSHKIITQSILSKEFVRKCICSYIISEDSLIILQVLRYIDCNIYFSPSLETWLKLFVNMDILTSITFILNNSINSKVLSNTLKVVNSVCSCLEDESDKIIFKDIFINERFSKAIIVGYLEICNQLSQNQGDIQTTSVDFLDIISTIINLESKQSVFDIVKMNLITTVNKIVINAFNNHSAYLVDIVQHITASLIVLNTCEVQSVKTLCSSMFVIWSEIIKKVHSDSEKSDFEDSQEENKQLLNVLPQYFVRTIIQLSVDDLKDITRSLDEVSLQALKTTITEMIVKHQLDEYFGNVPGILENA